MGAPVRKTRAQMEREVIRFNDRMSVGETINVYPGAIGGRPVQVKIAEPGARLLGGHTSVVQVDSRHGCIALTHVIGWGC